MLEYFDKMCEFADALKQTIIISGDFNLTVLDWKDEVEKNSKVEYLLLCMWVHLTVGTDISS